MNYIFYSYYISILLKGKLKAVEISLSVLLFLCVAFLGFRGIVHFLTGNPVGASDVLFVLLFIYSLMNAGYAVFNQYIPSAEAAVKKENIKNQLSEQKTEVKLQEGEGAGNSILMYKRYGTGIKDGPKGGEIKKEEIKSSPKTVNNKNKKEEVPALDININSTQDSFEEEKKEEQLNYSGVIGRAFEADPADAGPTEDAESAETSSGNASSAQVFEDAGIKIIETPLPETENGLYERLRKKKYN